MINFNEPLKESNLFTSEDNPQVIGIAPPLDDSFGLMRHESQDGFYVSNKYKTDYEIYFFNVNTNEWFLYSTVTQEKSLTVVWPEEVDRVYFKIMEEPVIFRVVGLRGALVADDNPLDGLSSNKEDFGFFASKVTTPFDNGFGGSLVQKVGPQGPKGEKGDSGIITSGKFKWSNWMGQAPGFQAGNMEYGGVAG